MTYSGAEQAKEAREMLGKALEALQQQDVPEDAMEIAQNIAQSVGALFEAERSSTEPDGRSCSKNALASLSQTLALLQDVKSEHPGVETATEAIALVMGILYPLTNRPSMTPSPNNAAIRAASIPAQAPSSGPPSSRPAPVQSSLPPRSASAPPQQSSRPPSSAPMSSINSRPPPFSDPPVAPTLSGPRTPIEANIGATTQSNFYVGFSGEISHGGVFLATYEVLPKDTSVQVLVTLPGGFEFESDAWVRFVRDPMDFGSESDPGMGIQFENLSTEARELVLRFIRKRPPMFYDV